MIDLCCTVSVNRRWTGTIKERDGALCADANQSVTESGLLMTGEKVCGGGSKAKEMERGERWNRMLNEGGLKVRRWKGVME